MNCNIYQSEIEELTTAQALSSESVRHLEKCSDCRAFYLERKNLWQMLGRLSQVKAPNDFNFRLKSRLRKTQQPATLFFGQKAIWLTSSATVLCFLLIMTFVLTRGTSPIVQPENSFVAATEPKATPNSDSQQIVTPTLSSPEVIQPDKLQTKLVATHNPAKIIERRNVAIKSTLLRKVTAKNDQEIHSVDSGLDNVKPPIMASGFNDQLATPKKQTADGLLRTVGIETENKAGGLSVISINPQGQAARSALRAGDIIQKVNGENPLAVSGNEFKEFKLIVRRNNQTQEITITTKPQN